MRVALTSDLHRGFSNKTDRLQRKYFERWLEENGMPDVLVLAGDIASHKPKEQVNTMLRTVRSHFSCPVLAVRGNHDFWHCYFDGGSYTRPHPSLTTLNADWEENCSRHGVINLEGNVVTLPKIGRSAPALETGENQAEESITFAGWLSWWDGRAPDQDRMSKQVSIADMRMLEEQTFSNMVHRLPDSYDENKLILVTHMTPNLSGPWSSRPRLVPDCLAMLCGHTHLLRDMEHSSTEPGINVSTEVPNPVRVCNSGPDYDRPSIYTLDTSTGIFSGTGGNTRRHF